MATSPGWSDDTRRLGRRGPTDCCVTPVVAMDARDTKPSRASHGVICDQQAPPARTRKNDSMSASVAESPSALKSAESHAGQQLPAMQAKKASMSASVAESPSWLKSAEPQG